MIYTTVGNLNADFEFIDLFDVELTADTGVGQVDSHRDRCVICLPRKMLYITKRSVLKSYVN